MSPPPSRPPRPEPSGEASSPASSAASTEPPNGAGPFFADAGPGFDPEAHADEAPPVAAAELADALGWDQSVVEGLLVSQGSVLHTAIGKAETDFVYTRDELRAIAPPLTRILNRYDATKAAAATGDELALMIGLAGYVGRSVTERRAALRALEDADAEAEGPEVFVPAEGPVQPPADFSGAFADHDVPPIPPRRP